MEINIIDISGCRELLTLEEVVKAIDDNELIFETGKIDANGNHTVYNSRLDYMSTIHEITKIRCESRLFVTGSFYVHSRSKQKSIDEGTYGSNR
jgi:hypothetical protein